MVDTDLLSSSPLQENLPQLQFIENRCLPIVKDIKIIWLSGSNFPKGFILSQAFSDLLDQVNKDLDHMFYNTQMSL